MTTLLVVRHTPTRGTAALGDALVAGANDDAIEGVEVRALAPDEASAADVLAADGIVVLCPANFGYLATREWSREPMSSRLERSET